MLAQQFSTRQFIVSFIVALVIAGIFAFAARHYNQSVKTQKFSAGSFREPIGYLMGAIGFIVPLIVSAMAYLFEKDPDASYALLLSATAVLFIAFIVASWLTFALASRATDDDKIVLTFPKDWPYRAASGVVYVALVLGVLYVAWFFLVDFHRAPPALASSAPPILIERAAPRVGLTRATVLAQLGEPSTQAAAGRLWRYRAAHSSLSVEFDEHGSVSRVTEER